MSLPEIVTAVAELRARVAAWRGAGERVALVPTMGALHEGHLALVRHGREIAGRVVVSVFVNPKQFAANEDFGQYPRTVERDRTLLGDAADLVFAPTPADMYPPGFATAIDVDGPSEGYEGATRPGHFSGVATVVAKLFGQCAPDVALFGEKDWQQLQVVRRLVTDLDLPLAIVGYPTVRDAAGLALSSRNAYLSPGEIAVARGLNGELRKIAATLAQQSDWPPVLAEGRAHLAAVGLGAVDYLDAVDAETLRMMSGPVQGRPARLLAAVKVGGVRLLDNMPIVPGALATRR